VFAGNNLWRNRLWKEEVYGLASVFGAIRARDDFEKGKIRLFELDLSREQRGEVFTGKSEGPFEIWKPQYLPLLGYPSQYATEQMVASYNDKMRYMNAHPEDFTTKDGVGPPTSSAPAPNPPKK